MSCTSDQPIHHPRRNRRRKLLCCLFLLSPVPARSRAAFANSGKDPWRKRRRPEVGSSHNYRRRQDHESFVRVEDCPLLSCIALRGGGGDGGDGSAEREASDDIETETTTNPLGGTDSDDKTSLLKTVSKDDDEIDAYIEQLIASVEDESDHKQSAKSFDQRNVVDGDHVDTKGGDEALTSTEVKESDVVELSVPPESFDAGGDTVSASSRGEDDVSARDPKDALHAAGSSDCPPGEKEPSPESESSISSVKGSSSQAKSPRKVTPPPPPPARTRRLPPPNPLYRALLRRRGWGGHVLAMALVTVSEFCELWLPVVAHAWDALVWKRLVGDVALLEGDDGTGGRRQQQRRQPPSSAKGLESKVRSSKRTGANRKQLQQLQKQADQAALRVLRYLTKDSKYRHTSVAFQKRHGLGPFAAAASKSIGGPDGIERTLLSGSKPVPKSKSRKEENEEEDDVDWILEALTTAKEEEEALVEEEAASIGRRSSSSRLSKVGVQPLVALEVGPTGPAVSVGVEFSIGGRDGGGGSRTKRRKRASSSLESVIRDTSTIQRSATSRVTMSDRDSGVLGRIRAAASDGIGRSLLGAYPGDAAPISEAANPRGVLDLASRYGYGEWSEEDDDEEGDGQEHDHGDVTSQRRKRRNRATSSRPSRTRQQTNSRKKSRSLLGVEFDFSSDLDAGLRSSSRESTRGAAAPSKNPARQSSSPPTRSPRLEQRTEGVRLGPTSTAVRRGEPVRPAMERANETRRQSMPASGRGAPVRPAMERVNQVKRRRRNGLDNED